MFSNRNIQLAAAVGCFVLMLVNLYPGYIYSDSFDQYTQALKGEYNDWHPPMMAAFWRVLLLLTGSAASLTVLNIFTACTAVYLLTRNLRNSIALPIIFVLLMSPLFFLLVAILWKDVELALVCLLSSAILVDSAIRKMPLGLASKVAVTLLLLVASLFRANAPFVTSILLVSVWFGWRLLSWRPVAAAALCLALIGASGIVAQKLLLAQSTSPVRSLEIFDLAGVSALSGDIQFSSKFSEPEQKALLHTCYTPLHWDSYMWGNCAFASERLLQEDLKSEWISAVTKHPESYLLHRLLHFNSFLRFAGSFQGYLYFANITPGIQGEAPVQDYKAVRAYNRLMEAYPYQPWHFPFVWLAISMGLTIATLRPTSPAQSNINALSTAASVYMLAYLAIGVASDFRYALPSIYLTIAALLCWSASTAALGQKPLVIAGGFLSAIILTVGVLL